MDSAVCRYLSGSLFLRTVPNALSTPVGDKSLDDGCMTWAGDELRTALANTASMNAPSAFHTSSVVCWERLGGEADEVGTGGRRGARR